MQWETVIGLEIHAQLKTKSKIFSGSSTLFGQPANTQASIIDLGMPGVLPVLNQEAVLMAVKFGLGVNAQVDRFSVFARKNYFYPDLPKGYQISQFEKPIVGPGKITINLDDGETKTIGITRAHLEEDAGKSLHEDFAGSSGIDLNRAGTPLLEIVSEPEMRSAKEAIAYLKAIHSLVKYLDICDGNMAEGSFRCDANVSVRPVGQEEFGTRAEIKNVNSFRFVEKAIDYEVERQIMLIENGGKVVQETRLYDANKNETRSMRGKEEANDYRYFPDPDLLPVEITQEILQKAKDSLPELPDAKKARFMTDYQLSEYDARLLVSDKDTAEFFEKAATQTGEPKLAANWVLGELSAQINKEGTTLADCPISAENFAQLLARIVDNTISGKIAKDVFAIMWTDGQTADHIIESKGLKQVTDSSAIEALVDEALTNNPAQVADYKAGKTKMMGFFVGQVMKASKGKANPQQVNELLAKKLN